MESPYYEMTHDFEEENHIAERNFRSGYLKGYHDAVMKEQEHIIRCKDCKAWKQYGDMNLGECELYPEYNKMGEWFCNFGERKECR